MSRFVLPQESTFDINGLPQVGGTLDFHNVGLLTDKNTYPTEADAAAGTNPNSNPVVANASGNFGNIWLVGDYDVTLKNSAGSTIWGPEKVESIDELLISDLSQSFTFKTVVLMQASTIVFPVDKKIHWQGYRAQSDGGSNWGLVKSGAHTDDGGSIFTLADGKHVEANLKGKKVSCKKFGADGEEVIDSALSIQNTLDFTTNSFLPIGRYKYSANLTMHTLNSLRGPAGGEFTAVLVPTAAVTVALSIGSSVELENIKIDCTAAINASGLLISKGGLAIGNVINVTKVLVQDLTGTGHGVEIREAVGVHLTNVRTVGCDSGLLIQGDTGSFPTYLEFDHCAFRAGGRGGLIRRGYGINFHHCLFEDNSLEGLKVDTLDRVERVTFSARNWFERNNQSNPAGYQLLMDGTNPGAITRKIDVSGCFFFESNIAKAAKFSEILEMTFSKNLIPDFATDSTGDTDGSTAIITGMTSTARLSAGEVVTVSAGFPTGTITIVTVDSGTQITVDVNSDSAQTDITVIGKDPTVLFDSNSTGFISDQELNTRTGNIVDSTGFMIDDGIDSGEWTTHPFDAGEFTTELGTITVAPADVINYDFKVFGKTMHLNINVINISLSAGTQFISAPIPAGKTAKKAIDVPCSIKNIGVADNGTCNIAASGSVIIFRRTPQLDLGISTNQTNFSVNLVFEIN